MSLAPGFHALWPTPFGIHRYPQAEALNPQLARMLVALRRLSESPGEGANEASPPAFHASDDDLLRRIRLPEWQQFIEFVVASLQDTVSRANAGAWPAGGMQLRVAIEGMWFQISNRGAFHDIHSHGNCSWSGVYVVQVDDAALRERHPVFGAANGVTRFQGPRLALLGGAHADLGNAYLQVPQIDVAPLPGQLLLFPSWLLHQALPYEGALDRIVISFNASVHAAQGSDRLHGFASA